MKCLYMGGIRSDIVINIVKEELQYYVLNFIYHDPEYSKWIMYGGSALRIIYNLDRMSVDLDFEISNDVTDDFLNELKKIETYFIKDQGASEDYFSIKIDRRGLLLKFNICKDLGINNNLDSCNPSNQIHVKIDLNCLTPSKVVKEYHIINHNQFSFAVLTYNMSGLMASKLCAIFLRGKREIGWSVYDEKGRDIYDLLWYMSKKIIPDFDYIADKKINIKEIRTLFDKLTIKMNSVSDKNLKEDLTPLFLDQSYINNWLANWRTTYINLIREYNIKKVTDLYNIQIHQDFNSENFYFSYYFKTTDNNIVRFIFNISNYWMEFAGDFNIKVDESVIKKISSINLDGWGTRSVENSKFEQLATLFYSKIKKYLEKTSDIIYTDVISTKLIRMTADKFDQNRQILLDKSTLISCDFDDLLM